VKNLFTLSYGVFIVVVVVAVVVFVILNVVVMADVGDESHVTELKVN
jgi:hypothetical protein